MQKIWGRSVQQGQLVELASWARRRSVGICIQRALAWPLAKVEYAGQVHLEAGGNEVIMTMWRLQELVVFCVSM